MGGASLSALECISNSACRISALVDFSGTPSALVANAIDDRASVEGTERLTSLNNLHAIRAGMTISEVKIGWPISYWVVEREQRW